MTISIPQMELRGQYLAIKEEIDSAVARTLESGWYVLGREVTGFEDEFSAYLACKQSGDLGCVGVNSGTDALHLSLRACGVGPGDEVITVAHTAVATAAAISLAGAEPIFVDIDPDTYTMDPTKVEPAITPRTRAIVPVHIYGHPVDMEAVMAIAQRAGIRVIEDCAQAHGARYRQQSVGSIGDLGCFSFYPTKNLGAMGDGGAVVGRDPALVERVRFLREYGWTPETRFVSQFQGMNSRLDELQAAILRVKLRHLDGWNAARRAIAQWYTGLLAEGLSLPLERPDCFHVYHQYVVRTSKRDVVRRLLQEAGVGTGIHYPVPVHLQPAYAVNGRPASSLPRTEQAALEIISLPVYPHLPYEQVEQVADAIRSALSVLASSGSGQP
jgi:dTDP-4-amino-4,6-dideoxygalactose transaminase